LRVKKANQAFYELFQISPQETENRFIGEIDNKQWDIPGLIGLLKQILSGNTRIDNFQIEHEFPRIGYRVLLLNASQVYLTKNSHKTILVAIEDVTVRKLAEKERARLLALE